MLSFITQKIQKLFTRNSVDEASLTELDRILLQADTGFTLTKEIISNIRAQAKTGSDLRLMLKQELLKILDISPYNKQDAAVHLLVGINGSGKTTCASKLAFYYKNQGKSVLLVAADTFRAAAQEQLAVWAERAEIPLVTGKAQEDPSAVVFRGCQAFLAGNYDRLIIDTAGRLQTKANLMQELSKMKRIIEKQLGAEREIDTLLTVDSMLGQNSLEQAKLFHESTQLTGIILTKMDGSGKAGVLFAIAAQLKIPIAYISFGESIETIAPFEKEKFIENLLGKA